jgi:hypothetical protein
VNKREAAATAAPESTDLAVLDDKLDKAIALMEHAGGRIGRVVAIAQATKTVRDLVVANWGSFEELKNSQLGWSTDERPGETKYSPAILQTALTQAILKGALPVNKEIGVISGQAYLQKSYFERQIRERGDIADVRVTLDVPEISNGRAIVGGVVSWRREGKEDRIECRRAKDGPDQRIPVKVNAGMSDDAILGKATRKILARMLARVDGSQAWEDLGGEPDTIDGTATASTDATQAALPWPKPPTREETEAKFREWSERIASAATGGDAQSVLDEARAHALFSAAPRTWQDKLVQRSIDRASELKASPPEQSSGKPTTDELVDRYIVEINHQGTQKDVGDAHDKYLPPDGANPHGFTAEQQKVMVKAFQDRLAEVRSK